MIQYRRDKKCDWLEKKNFCKFVNNDRNRDDDGDDDDDDDP
jgi:hypothetical protein